ncbi:MAG: 50S ribosomal protein L6 [Oscillospiraceae bacterium]|jgi:predicted Fe-Mo cluster-binding NifX family protein
MKIAVACDGNRVSAHFGHCQGFEIFTVEKGKVTEHNFHRNPGHKPGFLPNYLNDLGVNTIITGGIGAGAIDIFNDKQIEVVSGASGEASDVVDKYLKGELKSTGSVCREHAFEATCGNH